MNNSLGTVKRIVLVRAIGPRNVGSVLRATANFGPAELVLVAPKRKSMLVHPDFTMMAHGVENVRDKIRVVATFAGGARRRDALGRVHSAAS
jgi:tRNA C32,U32 (ribose-2'-O)-methylase TrmJ